MASELISIIPGEKQAEAISNLASIQTLEPEKVKTLEESFKNSLSFTIGGEDRLAAILDLTDDMLRDKAISDIERKDYSVASRIRVKAKSMEAIIRSLEDVDLQKLIRHLDPTIFARILNSSAGDVQTKSLEALSTGAAERIREEMKYAGAFPAGRLKIEKRTVVSTYKKLLASGEIQENGKEV
jgi:flagellar motor switch protein FliG